MSKVIDTILDRICAAIGALIFCQLPAFMQQYMQRLSGSVYELKLQVDNIAGIARSSHLTVPQYLDTFKESDSYIFQAQGDAIQSLLSRFDSLNHALNSLESSTWLSRPFTFIVHMHSDVFYGTLSRFTPSLNISTEGIFWSFIGLFIGYIFYHGLKKALGNIIYVFKRKSKKNLG